MTQARDYAEELGSHARNIHSTAKEAAASRISAEADRVQSYAAEEMDAAAQSMKGAADAFDARSLQSEMAAQLAGYLDGLSSQLREADLDHAMREVGDFARKNPLLVLGGAALAGFAAARFLKAREERDVSQQAGPGAGTAASEADHAPTIAEFNQELRDETA